MPRPITDDRIIRALAEGKVSSLGLCRRLGAVGYLQQAFVRRRLRALERLRLVAYSLVCWRVTL